MPEATDPTVHAFVAALNAGDRKAVETLLSADITMSDDGSDRDPIAWLQSEAFDSSGHLEIQSQSADGRELIANYSNSTYGAMRTRWTFTIEDHKIVRFETGQA